MTPGTRVVKTMGVRLSGRVVPAFYWEDSTDGTYSEPKRGDVPVAWDDGTHGYINPCFLALEKKS